MTIAGLVPVKLVSIVDAVGLGIGITGFTLGPLNVSGFLGGRFRGNVHQDVEGVLKIEFGESPTNFDLEFDASQDVRHPGFQYPFDVIILQPFARISFVNGAGASAFFRANVQALPA